MALFKNTALTLANAYRRIGEIGIEIIQNRTNGFDNSNKQKELKARLMKGVKLFRTVLYYSSYDVNGVFLGTFRIEDDEYNKLLRILIKILDVNNLPISPILLFQGYPSYNVGGVPGPPGSDGVNSFTYIGYATDAAGSGFDITPNPARKFIAFRNNNAPLTVVASIFAGLWGKYIGEDGAAGAPGAAGTSQYLFIGYADDNAGSGFTLTYNPAKAYISYLVKNVNTPPVVGDFPGWARYIGTNGTNGTDGNTILFGSGVPPGGLGVDGNFYIDVSSYTLYGPKTLGAWGSGTSMIGPAGPAGATGGDGANGLNAFLYIAYADDAAGNGFTTSFDPNKDYIAVKQTNTIIPSPSVADFAGLFTKYRGDGDNWTTNSNTSLTIGTGVKVIIVATDLAYSTGQRVVISVPSDSSNRMEGVCEGYDPIAGQLTVDVDTIYGSGTYASWDVSLQGAPVSIASVDGYYGSMATDQGLGGTPQTISTTPTKINQFDTVLSQSAGMAVSVANDNITVSNRGAYHIEANGAISSLAATVWTIQIYKNGVAMPNMITTVQLSGTGILEDFCIAATIDSVLPNDVFEVRASEAVGLNSFLLQQGRFDIHTIGSPNTEQFTNFSNTDVDTGTEIVDSFSASQGYYAVWEVRIRKGNNIRGVRVSAIWDGTNQPNFDQETPIDLGTVDVTLSCDFNAGNIRLQATAMSNDWDVSGIRRIIA